MKTLNNQALIKHSKMSYGISSFQPCPADINIHTRADSKQNTETWIDKKKILCIFHCFVFTALAKTTKLACYINTVIALNKLFREMFCYVYFTSWIGTQWDQSTVCELTLLCVSVSAKILQMNRDSSCQHK